MNIFWLVIVKKFISKSFFFIVIIFEIAFTFIQLKINTRTFPCSRGKYIGGNNYVLQLYFYAFNRIVS